MSKESTAFGSIKGERQAAAWDEISFDDISTTKLGLAIWRAGEKKKVYTKIRELEGQLRQQTHTGFRLFATPLGIDIRFRLGFRSDVVPAVALKEEFETKKLKRLAGRL